MHIFDLPNVMLIEIFEYLSYDEVSKKRLVSCAAGKKTKEKQKMNLVSLINVNKLKY